MPIELDNKLPTGSILTQKNLLRKPQNNNNNTNTNNDTRTTNKNLTKSSFVKFTKNNVNNIITKLNDKSFRSRANSLKMVDDKTNQNLISKTKETEKENPEYGLTTEIILNRIYNDGIIQIKLLNMTLLGLYFIIIFYFFLKLFMSLNFCSDIKRIFNDFGSITSRSSIVYYILTH